MLFRSQYLLDLVGNIATEQVLQALAERGATMPDRNALSHVIAMNGAIREEFATAEAGDH